jgi:hypothetical protein
MIKKFISAVFSVAVAAIIAVNPICQTSAFETYKTPVQKEIFLKHGNAVYFEFLDEKGQELSRYEIIMKNSAGVEVGRFYDNYNDKFKMSNSSGIDDGGYWSISEKYFADLIAPDIPRYIAESMYEYDTGIPTSTVCNLHDYSADNKVTMNYIRPDSDMFGHPWYNIYRVFAYPSDETTAFTIPANKIGIFVDKKWSSYNGRGYYQMGKDGSKKFFDNNDMYGNLKVFAPKKDPSELRFGITKVLSCNTAGKMDSYPKYQSKKTEYVKCKMKVTELFPNEEWKNYQVHENGIIIHNGNEFRLRKATESTAAFLTIVSGACVTVAMPDKSGNVEFYVEKNSRKISSEIRIKYYADSDYGTYFTTEGYGGKVHEIIIKTPEDFSDVGMLIDNIPAGQYTLELKSIYDEEIYSPPFSFKIDESDYPNVIIAEFNTDTELDSGDIDGNNVVDASDASNILAEYAALSTGRPTIFWPNQKDAADVNNDGVIDSSDASMVLAHYASVSTGGNGVI